MVTRPANVATKIGTTGAQINLTANYFRLIRKPTWKIYQYRVDFKPEVLLDGLRKYLIFTQKNTFGGYLFDGTQLFLTKKLEGSDVIEFMAKSRDEEEYMICLKYTTQVSMCESTALQILNLILRRSMAGLKLQLVGRNFFDPDASVCLDFSFDLKHFLIKLLLYIFFV